MAQVPYNPVPQADPGATLPEVHPDIPAAAFGGDVAHAITGFGRATEGAGNAIFERAMQLQQMNNQAEARKASADYTIEVGKLSAQYNTLGGDDAVKAMPAYGKALKELREKYKSGMSSPMSRNMFDNESLGTMSHAIINGASHSASQHKVFVGQSFEGAIKSRDTEVSMNPNDEKLVTQNAQKNANDVREWGRINGEAPALTEVKARAAVSATRATQIDGTLTTAGAIESRKVFDAHKDEMTPEMRKKYQDSTTNEVRNYLTTAGVKSIVDANTDADGNLKITEKELLQKAQELGKPYMNNDEKLAPALESAARQQMRGQNYDRKNAIYDANQTISGAILAGKKTLFDAVQDPQVALAYKSLPNKEKALWSDKFKRAAAAEGRADNAEIMKQLNGMAGKSESMHEILEIDPTAKELNLSGPNIKEVYRLQEATRKNMGKSAKADGYLKVLESYYTGQMQTLGFIDVAKRDKEKYNTFTGTVVEAVEAWRESKGKNAPYPTNQEFRKDIAPHILTEEVKKSSWGSWFDTRTFPGMDKAKPEGIGYEAFKKLKQREYDEKSEPIDHFEIERMWAREVFKAAIEAKKTKTVPTP